jgi:hypothetical protein
LPTAIARLGMDKIKKLSYQYFDLFVATYKNPMENFESFNQFNLTKVQTLKNLLLIYLFNQKEKWDYYYYFRDCFIYGKFICRKRFQLQKDIKKFP